MLLGVEKGRKRDPMLEIKQLSGSAIYIERDSDLSRFPHLVSMSFLYFYSFTMIVKKNKIKRTVTQKDRQRVVVKKKD
jgi:hypothetical protein